MTEIDIYVRYCETDAGGHVSNTSYFYYLEEARTKFFAALGYGPGERSVDFIVARTECDFLAQAYAGQILSVSTKVARIGTKSYTMAHEIKDAKTRKLIATGRAVIVCYDFQVQQTKPIPTDLRTKLTDHMGSVKEH